MQTQHPLLIEFHDHGKFVYPSRNGYISLLQGESVHLACSGDRNYIRSIPSSMRYYPAKCVVGKLFEIDNSHYDLEKLRCNRMPSSKILKNSYARENQSTDYRIGFQTDLSGSFAEVILVHRDKTEMSTVYARSLISKSIEGSRQKVNYIAIDQSYCCGDYDYIEMDDVYDVTNQMKTLRAQFVTNADHLGKPYFSQELGIN